MSSSKRAAIILSVALLVGPSLTACELVPGSACGVLTGPRPGGGGGAVKPKSNTGTGTKPKAGTGADAKPKAGTEASTKPKKKKFDDSDCDD